MSEPFLSEIKIVSFNFPPKGWALCNGQIMAINQNQALFALLGTNYGGNGQTTFGLPNLQGRLPIHMSSSYTIGQTGGASSVTLTQQQMPAHNHFVRATTATAPADANGQDATNNFLSQSQVAAQGGNVVPVSMYDLPNNPTTLIGGTIGNVGGSQPHTNMGPYLVLNFIIALQGIFPSRN